MGDDEVRQTQQAMEKKAKMQKPGKQEVAKAPIKEDKKETKEDKEIEEQEKKLKSEPKKIVEKKVVLEREYIVPLRKGWLKVPVYKRANKAVKTLKEFIAQHMKVYDRDLRKVKVDILLNNEIRFRGMKKPLSKIKVRALRNDDGTVDVKLVNIPKHIEFELARNAKKQVEKTKKTESKNIQQALAAAKAEKEAKKAEGEEGKEDKETKEKEIASREATQAMEKAQANQGKHTPISKTSTKRQPIIHRKALQK